MPYPIAKPPSTTAPKAPTPSARATGSSSTPKGGDDNREPDWFQKERGVHPHNEPGELYNLTEDLSQRRNQYAEHPEIVNRLKTLLEQYKKTGRSVPERQ